MLCPYCGTETSDSALYCPNCGSWLGETPQPIQPDIHEQANYQTATGEPADNKPNIYVTFVFMG